MLKNMYFLE